MENTDKLKQTLVGNAIFSFASGLTMIIANFSLSRLFNVHQELIFTFIGIGLMIFGLNVLFVARKKIDHKKKILTISIADLTWVVASLIIILTTAFNLSDIGYLIIGIVALIVLLFGVFQLKFNR